MNYGLPETLKVGEEKYEIRTDYRCILDICEAIEDPELDKLDKAEIAIRILYVDPEAIPTEDRGEALKQCFWFINGGTENPKRSAVQLVSWKKDIQYIIAPVNRVLGREIRAVSYDGESNTGGLHWWAFLSAYMEIGDCLFAQIVRIRNLKAKGKPLDKFDQEWYRNNQELVDVEQTYTTKEQELLDLWGLK